MAGSQARFTFEDIIGVSPSIQEAKKLLAQARKENLKVIRQLELDKVVEFFDAGIRGVDLLLSTYGPALSVISSRWPVYSSDADPLDSVHYRLIVALDANFTFTATYDSIYAVSRAVNLNYGTHYWWKVRAIDSKGNMTESDNVADFLTWVLGDANKDGAANIGDAIFIINYAFRGGPAPSPAKTGDFNGDCSVNIGDAVYMISYAFRGGPAPVVGCAE